MSTLVTINGSNLPTNSRADINGNFSALNADKMETSVLDTDTTLAANSDEKVPTQKAVKQYVDAGGNVNASTTAKGIVEEATQAEVDAGTATGGTGARLYINPSTHRGSVTETFTSDGTWTKDAGLKRVFVQVWGAGGSGGSTTTVGGEVGGGGGGGYAEAWLDASLLGDTESVTVGTGGAAVSGASAGNVGETSSFGTLVLAYGGGGGGTGTSGGGGGGGGGAISAGGTASGATAGTAGFGATAGGDGSGATAPTKAFLGAGGGQCVVSSNPIAGADAVWGGAGGGAAGNSLSNASAGGTSLHGGAGGAGDASASGNATAGSVPGGGGGGKWSNAGSGNSGAGGKGRVYVTEYYV